MLFSSPVKLGSSFSYQLDMEELKQHCLWHCHFLIPVGYGIYYEKFIFVNIIFLDMIFIDRERIRGNQRKT
ncbi:hypothetical protein SUSAZ_10990 [Sulfolobus acidocaldarius SUSAZ]|nr:hypothetical protein SUSAZ_10990 [Sulfolobus acidocaldarius SUSAZ]